MSKRLFVALDLPVVLRDVLSNLDPPQAGVRWLSAEQIHLTLSFLGDVAAEAEVALREKLSLVQFQVFFLPVTGVGIFPARGKPRVIWAGVGSGHPQLFLVYRRVQEAALAAGLEPDLRAWHPHITLARCRDGCDRTVRSFLRKHAEFNAGIIPIESFSLYSSVPGPTGSIYTRELEVSATRF